MYKRSIIAQGRAFCAITAPQCREKIAALAVDFLVDDCTVSTAVKGLSKAEFSRSSRIAIPGR